MDNIDRNKSDVSNNVTLGQFVEYFKNLNELAENEKEQQLLKKRFCELLNILKVIKLHVMMTWLIKTSKVQFIYFCLFVFVVNS